VFAIGQLVKAATVSRIKNTASCWWECAVKTVFSIANYLREQPVVLVFQNFVEII